MFKYYFDEDLKKLGLKRYVVCEMLDFTMPTLQSRLNNPGTFTVAEIKTLKDNGFESMNRLI
jgi:hypothetical protein|tara:strand:+ start:2652 stop:2837 length:186 start_codon:yes stop_codon:yes gene_type:complete